MKELAKTQAVYLVDAGDLFFKHPYVTQAKRELQLETARAILNAYNLMDCQVLNVGANDLGAGLEFITEMATTANFPFISANVTSAGSDVLLYEPSHIVKTHDMTLGFVGVSIGDRRLKEFDFKDPVESAKVAIAAIRDKVDLVFLLANVDDRTELELAQAIGDIDFLIRSKTGSLQRNPKEHNGVVVVRNGKQGKYAGALKIRRVDNITPMKNVSAQQKRIKFSQSRLLAMSKGLEDGKTLEEHYAKDEKRLLLIKRLRDEQANNESLIKKLKNSYYFDPMPLNEKVADTPEVAEVVAAFMPTKKASQHK